MKKTLFLTLLLLLLTGHLWAQQVKLPVFFLKYDYGLATEEEEDEEDLEQTSNKHRVSLRIKEQFTRHLIMNLYFIFYMKDYIEKTINNYHYFILNPDLTAYCYYRFPRVDGLLKAVHL